MKHIAFLGLAAALSLPVSAQQSGKIYAQELVDMTVAQHPEVLELALHVTPPKGSDNIIIASNTGQIGKKASGTDLAVINSGQSSQRINEEGNRFESELVLQDVSGDTIGAVSIVLPYKKGNDKAALHKQAEKIRDELRRHVINVANLMDPFPYVPNFPASPYAQKLIDETMAKHPELLVLAMHVSTASGDDYPIIASSIGRIGKKADGDDMQVVQTGQPILGAYGANKTRFGIELVMRDIAGRTLGALSPGLGQTRVDEQQQIPLLGRQHCRFHVGFGLFRYRPLHKE